MRNIEEAKAVAGGMASVGPVINSLRPIPDRFNLRSRYAKGANAPLLFELARSENR
jgi:hypothetical protein